MADPPESGDAASQADIARREGITRARIARIMRLLRLAPEIQQQILSMPDGVNRSSVTERMLRPITAVPEYRDQLRACRRPRM